MRAGLSGEIRKRYNLNYFDIIPVGVAQLNEKNLIPNSERTPKELQEMTRKGGIKSGEARRRRRTLREELLLMLENEDIQQSLAVALIKEATEGNASKSVRGAFETIRDTIGEKPAEKVETKQTVYDMSKFSTEEIKAMLNDEI